MAALRFAFDQLQIERIEADIDVDNRGCIRLAETVGMQYEGRLRHNWKTTLGWRDSVIYSLLAAEYAPLKARWQQRFG